MKPIRKILLVCITLCFTALAYSQPNNSAKSLTDAGIKLHDAKQYDEAIAKYKEAIKADPKYYTAYYEMAFTLNESEREKEAIPYLETALKLEPQKGEAYNMLGNIYDDDNQPDKAVDYYLKGIKADPDHQRLYFNLAITYYRQNKYTEAENKIITAIKLEPGHASSQRMYAMITKKLNKPGCALLGWCSFLLLEPNKNRSINALAELKAIVNNGVKRTDEKNVSISVSPDNVASLMMPLAVTNATAGRSNLSPVDSLTLQLTSLFSVAHTITMDKNEPFVKSYFSDFFLALGQSGNMPAFVRFITLSTYADENQKWFKEHDKELTALDNWVNQTKRTFQ